MLACKAACIGCDVVGRNLTPDKVVIRPVALEVVTQVLAEDALAVYACGIDVGAIAGLLDEDDLVGQLMYLGSTMLRRFFSQCWKVEVSKSTS